MDVLGQNYTIEGLVRCTSHRLTVAKKAETQWVYIDDMCVLVKTPHLEIFYIIILVVGFSLFLESLRLGLTTI